MDTFLKSEAWNISKVWIIVSVSLTYCYLISTRIPKGVIRLLFFLPIMFLFLLVPFLLSSVFFQLFVGLFIGWYANFKLLLLALSQDDLLPTDSPISLQRFIILISLPITSKKITTEKLMSKEEAHPSFALKEFVVNIMVWFFLVQSYMKKDLILLTTSPVVTKLLHSYRMCVTEQLVFTVVAVLAKPFLNCELEPQFIKPYASTSVQNFWSKRWNLYSSRLLKSTIYEPTKSLLTCHLGRQWATNPAILVTFSISGLMHEVLFFYVTRKRPTWEVTWFYIINGVWVAIEIGFKKKATRIGWTLSPIISLTLTVVFMIGLGTLLSWVELFHSGADMREIDEYARLGRIAKSMVF